MHNAASNDDELDYIDVPWGGWRPSVLSDMLVGRKDGGGDTLVETMPQFGDTGGDNAGLMNMRDTGGYVIATELGALLRALLGAEPC